MSSLYEQWAAVHFTRPGFSRQIQEVLADHHCRIGEGELVIDHNGVVLYINESGREMLQLTTQPVVGRHIADIVDFRPVILEAIHKRRGYIDREFTVRSSRLGAVQFVKSAHVLFDEQDQVVGVVDTFRRVDETYRELRRADGTHSRYSFRDIVGEDPDFLEAAEIGRVSARCHANILLEGESGTGKEMFAHAIHNASDRAAGPFVIVDCASLPHSLIESELFGYESGSFTGALKDGHAGKFEQAHLGTIFLDEIGEMPLEMQSRLLRVLQDKTFTRIGGKHAVVSDARVIAATNKNLFQEVRAGRFREDLYYRLNVLGIRIPPLRRRKSDIPLLACHFLDRIARDLGRPVPIVYPGVREMLCRYDWPGNIRELQNMMERVMILSTENRITPENLPRSLMEVIGPCQECDSDKAAPAAGTLEQAECGEIRRALEDHEGNISRCARYLGISRNTLYRKIQKYRIFPAGAFS